jgi:hypothetical protein
VSITKLAIIGAGNVRCTPPVLGALANYFGERPLEVRLYDADAERLDLFDQLARLLFRVTDATHQVRFRLDSVEAIEDADRVILQVGTNCARKYLRQVGALDKAEDRPKDEPIGSLQKDGFTIAEADDSLVQRALGRMLEVLPAEAEVLSLQREAISLPDEMRFRRLDWPAEPNLAQRRAIPHQALRWIKGEEMPHALLKDSEQSPLKAWLDDVTSAGRVR